MRDGQLGSGGGARNGRGDDSARRLVPRPERRAEASRGDCAHRSVVGDVGSARALVELHHAEPVDAFHQRPAFAAVVDFCGALLTALALLGALLGGSGCATTGKPCSAWNAGRAAACAVCALPECGSDVGGGEVLVDPAEACESERAILDGREP